MIVSLEFFDTTVVEGFAPGDADIGMDGEVSFGRLLTGVSGFVDDDDDLVLDLTGMIGVSNIPAASGFAVGVVVGVVAIDLAALDDDDDEEEDEEELTTTLDGVLKPLPADDGNEEEGSSACLLEPTELPTVAALNKFLQATRTRSIPFINSASVCTSTCDEYLIDFASIAFLLMYLADDS